jgi:hypothetical protein
MKTTFRQQICGNYGKSHLRQAKHEANPTPQQAMVA